MEIYDERAGRYIDLPPEQAAAHLDTQRRRSRYDGQQSLVPALPEKRANPVAYPLGSDTPNTLAESHLAALETIRETATPIDRAIALAIRSMPLTVVWLVLCFGLMVAFDSDWPLPFLLFAGLTAVTYWALNQQDYRHSASGLERHKADLAHDLQKDKQEKDHELKSQALGAYLRYLERDK